ncbi:glycosyltransferase family 2 protein [Parazoarcus communis]|uniref:Glycosyltransferase 2-like domain-containing protein n=1 Tax=Parazoarcus communis SWub3 = DSM 12120 TaxID=1121029 RepID=A0A323URV9_9RHOO|nr:glycosyltransferase family 2 protein [Parazoarcus communis]NMG72714.1 glycosyltransferase [Parazoarcus communis SWub3 = DSM 12120]PZA15087.1 hypothetical protein DNK49_18135 [Azoarcus communis] [Parazoarcus communis SWub3 = DSM 12120]
MTASVPSLHIVITDFNGFGQTKLCLQALRSSFDRDFHVIVVDHGTTDDTRRALECHFPEVTRLRGSPELWWAGATNLGVRKALELGAARVMLLNNDCYVTPETISALGVITREYPDAIVAPVQRDAASGRITSIAPRDRLWLGFPTVSGGGMLTPEVQARGSIPCSLIIGGRGVSIPSGVFNKLGLFDEVGLPHYFADHDFYFRARKAGIPLCVATRSVVDVDRTRTSVADGLDVLSFSAFVNTLTNRRSHRNLRDAIVFFRKHYPIQGLYGAGVMFYFTRYFLVYLASRIRRLVRF